MDPVANPFRPGAGRRPPLLAGRESVLEDFEVVRRRAEELGEGDRSWVLTGLRGVGKTVLLNELLAQANERRWITAKLEAGPAAPLHMALDLSLQKALRTATGRHSKTRLRRLLGVFKAFSLKLDPAGSLALGMEIEPIRGVADSGRLADDLGALLEVLGEAARDLGIGVLILVDELQEAAPDELVALNAAIHHIGQAAVPLPLVMVGAGLPSLPGQLAEATSYAERLYDYRSIGLLGDEPARAALTVPAHERDVDWEAEGLSRAVRVAGGYPYFIQAIGKHVWDQASTSPISADDVRVGLIEAGREVDEGLYRSRWDRATPAQRDLLRALAAIGADRSASIADLARFLGKGRSSDLSVARIELIRKGLAYSPERGFLAFTVPGMHEFVGRHS